MAAIFDMLLLSLGGKMIFSIVILKNSSRTRQLAGVGEGE